MYFLNLLPLATCMIVVSCAAPPTVPTEETADPPKSRTCLVRSPTPAAYAGDVSPLATEFTMKNDGGWCWYLRTTHVSNITQTFGVKMHVVSHANHGSVKITPLANATRIAYKPEPGFIGTDEFSVINDLYNIERAYKVNVTK